jgi:hypothetical protein
VSFLFAVFRFSPYDEYADRTNESSGLAGKILTAATESSGKQNSLEDLL